MYKNNIPLYTLLQQIIIVDSIVWLSMPLP